MIRILVFLVSGLLIATTPAVAGAGGYGSIVNKDGSITAFYRSNKSLKTYVAHFNKNGKFTGNCSVESMSAYQARKAYMKAQSKWRAGYVPRKRNPCVSLF